MAARRLRYCPQYCKSVHRSGENSCHKSPKSSMLPESRLQKRGPAKHPSAATSVQIHSVGSGSLKIAACRFEAFSHMHPRHKGKPHTVSVLLPLLCLDSPFHIRSIKFLFCSPAPLQLICSFTATFTAFPLQTTSSCSWDPFGSMGNKIGKTHACVWQTGAGDHTPDDTAAG